LKPYPSLWNSDSPRPRWWLGGVGGEGGEEDRMNGMNERKKS